MIFQGLTDKLANNAADMAQLQSQIATGNNYATPSDAADIVGRVQAVESRLKTLEADTKAVTRVKVGADAQARALEIAAEVMDRLKEIAFRGANDPQPQAVLETLAEEVAGIKRSLVDLANMRDADDRYVFGGARSGEIPYVLNADGSVTYEGSTSPLRVRVNDASYEDAAVPGVGVWKSIPRDGQAVDMFSILSGYEDALRSGSVEGRQQGLRDVEALSNNVGLAIAKTGAAQQRLEISERQAQETAIRAQKSLADLKELDFAAALAQLQKQELLMQASQSLLGRLSQLSLLDSIR
jgi:flagellar hook-associated protein 3 FlgL